MLMLASSVIMPVLSLTAGAEETAKQPIENEVFKAEKYFYHDQNKDLNTLTLYRSNTGTDRDFIKLTLSDDSEHILYATKSASGEKYVNKQDNLVFWMKGNEAFIMIKTFTEAGDNDPWVVSEEWKELEKAK